MLLLFLVAAPAGFSNDAAFPSAVVESANKVFQDPEVREKVAEAIRNTKFNASARKPGETFSGVVTHEADGLIVLIDDPCNDKNKSKIVTFKKPYKKSPLSPSLKCKNENYPRVQVVQLAEDSSPDQKVEPPKVKNVGEEELKKKLSIPIPPKNELPKEKLN